MLPTRYIIHDGDIPPDEGDASEAAGNLKEPVILRVDVSKLVRDWSNVDIVQVS